MGLRRALLPAAEGEIAAVREAQGRPRDPRMEGGWSVTILGGPGWPGERSRRSAGLPGRPRAVGHKMYKSRTHLKKPFLYDDVI